MNAVETAELIKLLKASGATYFKSGDFEVKMDAGVSMPVLPSTPMFTASAVSPPPQTADAVSENTEATEKLKGLIESLKMNDSDLIDKIFPAGAGG